MPSVTPKVTRPLLKSHDEQGLHANGRSLFMETATLTVCAAIAPLSLSPVLDHSST